MATESKLLILKNKKASSINRTIHMEGEKRRSEEGNMAK